MHSKRARKAGSHEWIQPPENAPGQYTTSSLRRKVLVLGQQYGSLVPTFRRQHENFYSDSQGKEGRADVVIVGKPQRSSNDAIEQQSEEQINVDGSRWLYCTHMLCVRQE